MKPRTNESEPCTLRLSRDQATSLLSYLSKCLLVSRMISLSMSFLDMTLDEDKVPPGQIWEICIDPELYSSGVQGVVNIDSLPIL